MIQRTPFVEVNAHKKVSCTEVLLIEDIKKKQFTSWHRPDRLRWESEFFFALGETEFHS